MPCDCQQYSQRYPGGVLCHCGHTFDEHGEIEGVWRYNQYGEEIFRRPVRKCKADNPS